jgi:hypothetical protein
MAFQQSINLPNSPDGFLGTPAATIGFFSSRQLSAVAATGATDTGVIRMNAGGTADAQLFAEQGTLAANGTAVAIIQPGVYSFAAVMSQAQNASNTFALTFGATVLTQAAAPTQAFGGLLQLVAGTITPNAPAEQVSVVMRTTFTVRQAIAKLTPSTTSLNVARVIATATAGGVVTLLTAAGCSIRIVRLNNLTT